MVSWIGSFLDILNIYVWFCIGILSLFYTGCNSKKISTVWSGVAWVPKLTGDCAVTIACDQRPVNLDDDNNDARDEEDDDGDCDDDSNGDDRGI